MNQCHKSGIHFVLRFCPVTHCGQYVAFMFVDPRTVTDRTKTHGAERGICEDVLLCKICQRPGVERAEGEDVTDQNKGRRLVHVRPPREGTWRHILIAIEGHVTLMRHNPRH